MAQKRNVPLGDPLPYGSKCIRWNLVTLFEYVFIMEYFTDSKNS